MDLFQGQDVSAAGLPIDFGKEDIGVVLKVAAQPFRRLALVGQVDLFGQLS